MSDDGWDAVPPADATAHEVQPPQDTNGNVDVPVPPPDVLHGVAPGHSDKILRMQESLERRLVDKQLRDEMARSCFTGARYQKFETELARYAMSVLRAWMYSGCVFQLTACHGFGLHPTDDELDELHRDSDVRDELATMTVALALPRFRRHALVEGGWRHDGGASLPTYFMGTCLYVFPNEFRKRRAAQRKWVLAHAAEARNRPAPGPVTDPAALAAGNHRVREALQEDPNPRTRAIVALTIDGYSQEEIAEMLGEASIRAVEGVLHRWRAKQRRRVREGGGSGGRR